jgi:hypothetical protein
MFLRLDVGSSTRVLQALYTFENTTPRSSTCTHSTGLPRRMLLMEHTGPRHKRMCCSILLVVKTNVGVSTTRVRLTIKVKSKRPTPYSWLSNSQNL